MANFIPGLNFTDLKNRKFLLPAIALSSVTSKSGKGVYASSDTLYKGAIFGRDSLEVAEDLMTLKPKLVTSILLTLASLQGKQVNSENEEEPGKIVHEYRNTVVDGRPIKGMSKEIFNKLSSKWGGDSRELAYYGSVDSTPHFLRVLDSFCQTYGNEILDRQIIGRGNSKSTMKEIAVRAADWLTDRLAKSRSGLLEFQKINPHGISNQVWKDSEEFYVHVDGQIANHRAPISSIELQALAYDALQSAARFMPEGSSKYEDLAKQLQQRTIELFWSESTASFSLGSDYDDQGKLRIIKTSAANQAALLDSSIFDSLPEDERHKYVAGIVEVIMSSEFLSDAGIRSRSLSNADLIPFWDYHGSFVSWPKETYDIAKGLRRQGFPLLARQLENRILNVCLSYKAYPEFVYVDDAGRVLASPPSGHTHGELVIVNGTNAPERVQAWTVSAVIAIIDSRLKNKLRLAPKVTQNAWQLKLEETILSRTALVNRHINPISLKYHYPHYKYKIDQELK
jgi:glycogen debranching enzyme